MKNITILLIVIFLSCKSFSQTFENDFLENCSIKKVELKVENYSKNIYFFFRKTNVVKHRRTDKVIDENGNVVVECVMKSKVDHDQYFFKKFKRIVIVNNEIHKVTLKNGKQSGKVIIYDFCGQIIEKKIQDSDNLREKYRF